MKCYHCLGRHCELGVYQECDGEDTACRKYKEEQPAYPCRSCIYFKECGDNMRTEYCKGRRTKSQKGE